MNPREAEIFSIKKPLGGGNKLYSGICPRSAHPTLGLPKTKNKSKKNEIIISFNRICKYATLQKNFEFSLSHLHKLDLIYVLLYTLRMARQCREQNQLPHLQTKKNAKTTKI